MIQIDPYPLWLGHAGDCRNVPRVLDAGIRAVVQLALEEPPVDFPRETIVARIPLYDGSGNAAADLRLAVRTVKQLLTSRTAALVCCGAGMSRAPAVAACALARVEGRTPSDCLLTIQQRHAIDVSTTLWHDLFACH